ncbi:MAG: tRNA (guanine-N(1)-)-methyltransferase [Chlamydiales bacterium]|nr:tRNA (guanine-N(1)-)-methyltransferase [Chlamydiales bacterium]MCH9619102.1 tRNA (guanine-N(1)-)-methyltransferase [Chlamydiales bacterium]MCH9622364.1 tRNA (guanine-N(1)-)-methyltransferase [Chlamydiales bacterium]
MKIDILSLFPEYFDSPFNVSMIKRAREKGLVDLELTQIREFAADRHKTVDDRPYGGGPGMVLKPGPVVGAVRDVRQEDSHVVYLSPQGSLLTAKRCEQLAEKSHLILLCGHYEGIDERVLKEVDEEISIGDYVLTSGMPAALVFVDAVVRFVPGVLGDDRSVYEDSFQDGAFDCPHYTRPEVFEDRRVPKVLLEGNHAAIEKWRRQRALEKTKEVRPDLVQG